MRITNDLLEKIDSICNTQGCTRSDFIKDAIENSLNAREESEKEEVPKVKVTRYSLDGGKTWIDAD